MSDKFPKEAPIPDLTRPDFGERDEEVKYTQDNIMNAEIKLGATLKAEFHKPTPIPDLRRPNFGKFDKDISTSLKHTSLAEKERNHKMSEKFP